MTRRCSGLSTPLLLSTLCCLLWGCPTASRAQATVTVCGGVEHVLLPPTFKDIVSGCNCRRSKLLRIPLDPVCCVPGVCATVPHCWITQRVIDVAEHWEDQPICTEVDPYEEYRKWLAGQVPVLPAAVLPAAYETARLDIEAMKLEGQPIPETVKGQMRELLDRAGVNPFTEEDIENARLLPESHWIARRYMSRDALGQTLGALVLLRQNLYDQLMTPNDHTTTDILCNATFEGFDYGEAILTLIHELVHVKQYREMGPDVFFGNYVLQVLQAVAQAVVEEDANPLAAADPEVLEKEADGVDDAIRRLTGRRGMAWVKRAHNGALGTDMVGCVSCNPYAGDTACSSELPLLCIKKNGYADPGVTPSGEYYGWTGAHIASTVPVRGFAIRTVADADAICVAHFGPEWQLAEFHDGNGGWNWHAVGDLGNRFHTPGRPEMDEPQMGMWVHINDQDGNCWTR